MKSYVLLVALCLLLAACSHKQYAVYAPSR